MKLALRARRDIKRIVALGLNNLPICVAKTQNSLSDNARLKGRPSGFVVQVQEVRVNAGAGFLVVMTGSSCGCRACRDDHRRCMSMCSRTGSSSGSRDLFSRDAHVEVTLRDSGASTLLPDAARRDP